MAARRCYGTEEAIAFIPEPGSDSEMSDLENSDDETDEAYILPERENESYQGPSGSKFWRWSIQP